MPRLTEVPYSHWWRVYLNDEEIDAVWHVSDDAGEVKRGLVEHDGYDPAIVVERETRIYFPERTKRP